MASDLTTTSADTGVNGRALISSLLSAAARARRAVSHRCLKRRSGVPAPADVDGQTVWTVSSLEAAVLAWLGGGGEVNATFKEGSVSGLTLLMLAAEDGAVEVVDLLLRHGAKIDHQASDRRTALVAASTKGHEQVVDMLRHGAEEKTGGSGASCGAGPSHVDNFFALNPDEPATVAAFVGRYNLSRSLSTATRGGACRRLGEGESEGGGGSSGGAGGGGGKGRDGWRR